MVEMLRRSIAALALLLLLPVAARALDDPLAQKDIYTSDLGVMAGSVEPSDLSYLGLGMTRLAAVSVNPGGLGQYLWGPYYDVSLFRTPAGQSEPQITEIAIYNVSPPSGDAAGIVFRLRFRDSKYGTILLPNVGGIVGCGQTWSATVFARSDGTVAVRSSSQTFAGVTNGEWTTVRGLDLPNGAALQQIAAPYSLTLADLQQGFFEVVPIESVTCQPSSVTAQGVTTWPRVESAKQTPGNLLSGAVTIVRPRTGHRSSYDLVGMSRFRAPSLIGGPVIPLGQVLGQSDVPGIRDCLFLDNRGGTPRTGEFECIAQASLALAKSRLFVPFGDSASGVRTKVVITQPLRHFTCPPPPYLPTTFPIVPYTCAARGERVGVRVASAAGEGQPWRSLTLSRAVTVVSISDAADENADALVKTKGATAGMVEIALDRDRKSKERHARPVLNGSPDVNSVLGAGFNGFEGLPVLALTIREWNAPSAAGDFEIRVPASRSSQIPSLPAN
jgi:hypothetical protein